jgi:hypothetical protein
MQKKFDKLSLGIIIGFVLPLIVFAIAAYFQYSNSPQIRYLGILALINFAPKILSLSVISNLLPFYVFLKTNRMYAVKGVLTATFGLAFIVFILFIFV